MVKSIVKIRKKPNNNITKVMAEERVAYTAALLLNLKSRRTIIDELVKKYNIQPKSCDVIISHAYAYIRDNYKTDRESIIIKHLEFYYDIATQWRDLDPKASLKAMEQIEKLLRLHQDLPLIQNNTLNLNMENVSDEQLIKAIENMKNR